MTDLPDVLRPHVVDHLATGVAATSSLLDVVLPGTGSFFLALTGTVIPGQRIDRIAEFAALLSRRCQVLREIIDSHSDRIATLDTSMREFAERLTPEQGALFEDGAFAAIRATTSDRIERIVQIVARGLDDDAEVLQTRRLVGLLNQLADEEMVVLCSYSAEYGRDVNWRRRHQEALDVRFTVPASLSEIEKRRLLERGTINQLSRDHLVALGLLRVPVEQSVNNLTRIASHANGRIPDKVSVTSRSSSPTLTPLGRMLLQYTGLEPRTSDATLDLADG